MNRIGPVAARAVSFEEIRANVEKTPVRCGDLEAAEAMRRVILEARAAGDSIGGSVECLAVGVPAGLGEPVYDKLEAELARAMLSINASTAFEIGTGRDVVGMAGSELNDPLTLDGSGAITFQTNRAGGIQGGISTGMPIRLEVSFRPPSSIALPQRTVDLASGQEVTIEVTGRHDPVIPPARYRSSRRWRLWFWWTPCCWPGASIRIGWASRWRRGSARKPPHPSHDPAGRFAPPLGDRDRLRDRSRARSGGRLPRVRLPTRGPRAARSHARARSPPAPTRARSTRASGRSPRPASTCTR